MRFVVNTLEKVYHESKTNEKTKRQVEYILRQFRQADNVRRNKIGRPINEESIRQQKSKRTIEIG